MHFHLLAEKGVRSEHKLSQFGAKMEELQKDLLAQLGETRAQSLSLYFLKDRATLASFTNFPANGYTDVQKGRIYFVDAEPYVLPLRHELMHALSWRLWGTPRDYWVSEGLAVAAASACHGYPLHQLAHALAQERKIVPFSQLEKDFDFGSLAASLQAASLVQYVRERFGREGLLVLWRQGLHEKVFLHGLTSSALQAQWLAYIEQESFKGLINWSQIKQEGCGG